MDDAPEPQQTPASPETPEPPASAASPPAVPVVSRRRMIRTAWQRERWTVLIALASVVVATTLAVLRSVPAVAALGAVVERLGDGALLVSVLVGVIGTLRAFSGAAREQVAEAVADAVAEERTKAERPADQAERPARPAKRVGRWVGFLVLPAPLMYGGSAVVVLLVWAVYVTTVPPVIGFGFDGRTEGGGSGTGGGGHSATAGAPPASPFPSAGPSADPSAGVSAASPSGSPRSSGPGGGSPSPNGGGSTEAAPATWGFAFVRHVTDPVGSTHPLTASPQHDTNDEANWTYGPWRLDPATAASAPTAYHGGTGRQVVTLPGVGRTGGIVLAQAYDYAGTGAVCQPVQWRRSNADEVVEVACFDHTGAPADIPVAVLFLGGTGGSAYAAGGERGFVHASAPAAQSYTPGTPNASGTGRISRTGRGAYTVELTAGARSVQVSPVGGAARYCALAGRTATAVRITCAAPGGTSADTAFVLAYAGRGSLLDDVRRPQAAAVVVDDAGGPVVSSWWLTKPGTPTVTRPRTGHYQMKVPLGQVPSFTGVTAHGGGYCSVELRNDYSAKDDVTLYVECLDASGRPANSGFDLAYATASASD